MANELEDRLEKLIKDTWRKARSARRMAERVGILAGAYEEAVVNLYALLSPDEQKQVQKDLDAMPEQQAMSPEDVLKAVQQFGDQ